jgi:hypothetical protein
MILNILCNLTENTFDQLLNHFSLPSLVFDCGLRFALLSLLAVKLFYIILLDMMFTLPTHSLLMFHPLLFCMHGNINFLYGGLFTPQLTIFCPSKDTLYIELYTKYYIFSYE